MGMVKTPFARALLALAMVGAGLSGPAASGTVFTQGAQASNPCALLKVEEIQTLAGQASVGDGVATSTPAIGSMACRYSWGVGVNRLKLDVIVTDAARMFPGMSAEQIKQRFSASVKAGGADVVIPEVGEAAVFTSDSAYYANAMASLKGRILEVHVDGQVARDKKDQVISLLKTAASRL
jgi:hypothetical protein